MRHKLLDKQLYDKKALIAATQYLEKKAFQKNTVNIPLVIAVFGIVFFIAFFLFIR